MLTLSAFNYDLPLIVNSTELNTWCGNQVLGSILGRQRILSPHRVLGPLKVLSPPRVLGPHRVLDPGSSQGPGSRFSDMLTITPTNLLKKSLTYSSIFKACLKKIWAATKASLVFVKNSCKSSRWQMLFKIGVLKNFAIFMEKDLCWSLLLIKLQAFRCFPVNIAKFLRAAVFVELHRVAASADGMFYIKDVAE